VNRTGLSALQRAAKAQGVAWQPLAAIAYHESGLNPLAVGDKGTSFGLDQEHQGGALPQGLTRQQIFNVDRQATQMARAVKALGIQGLPFAQQTYQISKRYERPTNVQGETVDANNWLRTVLPQLGAAPALQAPRPASPLQPTTSSTLGGGLTAQDFGPLQSNLNLSQQASQRAEDAIGKIAKTSHLITGIDLTPFIDHTLASPQAPAQAPQRGRSTPAPTLAAPTRTGKGYTVGNFEGTKVAAWMVPALKYARAHGWAGKLTSGLRSTALQAQLYARYKAGGNIAAPPGKSNHEIQNGGAFDATDAQQLNHILQSFPGKRPIYAPTVGLNDSVHFSLNGH
jgi:hypothetical protein